MNNKKILRVRKYKAGYEVRTELVESPNFEVEMISPGKNKKEETEGVMAELIKIKALKKEIIMKTAYTPEGDYIGDSKLAHLLCVKYGIAPEISPGNCPETTVCSIGFSKKNNKWYGWSHRAIHGFTIGDFVKKDDCTASSGWTKECLKEHPDWNKSLPIGFKATTLEDAKKMAIAFADSVG